MNIGETLSALRREKGLSQEQLAREFSVSRQTIGKWESDTAVPELDKLLKLSSFYGVTLDRLVHGAQICGLALPRKEPELLEPLLPFLLRAKRATYAGHGAETEPSRVSSHDFRYSEGAWLYYDTYLGSENFAGEEAVWEHNHPLWSMNYCGRVMGEGFRGDFLKAALATSSEEMPFRGPACYQKGAYHYHCRANGSMDWFEGIEDICCQGFQIYECRFHGGKVL